MPSVSIYKLSGKVNRTSIFVLFFALGIPVFFFGFLFVIECCAVVSDGNRFLPLRRFYGIVWWLSISTESFIVNCFVGLQGMCAAALRVVHHALHSCAC